MEVGSCGYVEKRVWICFLMESVLAETLFSASKSIACLLLVTVSLINEIDGLPKLTAIDESFSIHELHKTKIPDPDVKDASETEEDDDEDDDNADDQDDDNEDDDVGDEDFSGEGEEEGDSEDDPEANGNEGSDDDEDDDDDEGDQDDPDEDGEDDEDEDDVPQPPSKKRK